MDWADEIAEGLEALVVLEMTDSAAASIAIALRKAKADGMREAATIIQAKADSYLKEGTFIQADILADYATELGGLANQIEKGQ